MGGSLSEGRADCLPRGKPFGVSVGANSFIPLACRLSEGVQGASGKPPAGINKRQLCRRNSTLAGPDAPTPARGQGLQPYGALYCFGWRSEGGAGGRAESPPACSAERNLCRGSSPLAGPDAPTPAREKGLQPSGALTLFFRWRKKSVQKKASGTATPGKRLRLPILTAGLALSRAAWLARFRMLSCALGARLFPPTKWAGLFPSAAYRRAAPAQLAGNILNPCRVGCFGVACIFSQGKRPAGNPIHAGLFSEP